MRLPAIYYLLGTLLIFLSLSMLLPLGFAYAYGEAELRAFFFSMMIAFAVGLVLRILADRFEGEISIKDSFSFVGLAWFAAAIFGALPFMFAGVFEHFIDAFFEAMSGFTTTGATVMEDIETQSRSILLWRSFIQWLGGMGIIVLFVALLPRLGFKGIHMLRAELPGHDPGRLVPRAAETAKTLWYIYILLSASEVVLLMFSGLSFYHALAHTFTTMPTGGFSTLDSSIGGFSNYRAEIIIILFMLAAGGNFSLYYSLWKGQWRQVLQDEEFRFYIMINMAAVVIVFLTLYPRLYPSLEDALRDSVFQSVSILTTTGYVTADYDGWPSLARVSLFFLMFFGGCSGSTGGGIKQARILILLKYGVQQIRRILYPSAVIPIKLGGKVVPDNIVQAVVGYFFLYVFFFAASTLLISAFGLDFSSSFSAVAASLGNVGPGLGLVGPVQTYAPLPAAAKLLLTFLMILGRLEIYTVMILFRADLYFGQQGYSPRGNLISWGRKILRYPRQGVSGVITSVSQRL